MPGVTDTFWCTGDSFSLRLGPDETVINDSYATILSTEGNITQAGLVRGSAGAREPLLFLGDSALRDYWSFSEFNSSAIAGKILGMEAVRYGDYYGYVYHVPVGILLSYNGWTAGQSVTSSLGSFPHYMLNGPTEMGVILTPWYHDANIEEKIQLALPSNARWLTGISSYTDSYNFLENIPVSLCISGAATMSSDANPSLVVAIGTFWAYDEVTGGLNFPGFPAHNPSTPLRSGALLIGRGFKHPIYNPLWGAE